ncbi:MAG: hypothetical protein KDL87_15455, partial [Verrucomicrobiae bacterium]|nr:hypothetical protein [Verrucomicrobiae bacterium]
LDISAQSPWLVRDPRQSDRSRQGRDLPQANKPADATPWLDEHGRPYDPAKGFRGALRSQAEKILRTMGFDISHPADLPAVSTRDGGTEGALSRIRDTQDRAAWLFGLPGWKAPLTPSRVLGKSPLGGSPLRQEFLAIDLFSGGGAEGLKFNSELAPKGTLRATLRIDLDRLEKVDSAFESIGLLALVLRDLAEGDIPIGSGWSKGQGWILAEGSVDEDGTAHPTLPDWFRSSSLVRTGIKALRQSALSLTNL